MLIPFNQYRITSNLLYLGSYCILEHNNRYFSETGAVLSEGCNAARATRHPDTRWEYLGIVSGVMSDDASS